MRQRSLVKKTVQGVMEQRQNVASSYARSLQLHASAVVDVLMNQSSLQGETVANLARAGVIDGLDAGGLIDNQVFAGLEVGGTGALNTARNRDMMQAGYCNGVLYTWLAGNVVENEQGEVVAERARLKGLGETGLGAISQVLAKHVGANSYGTYTEGGLKTPSGLEVEVDCDEVARAIPEGSPVLFQELSSEFELTRSGSFYEYENRACEGSDEAGFNRYRHFVEVDYDHNGAEIGRNAGEWEEFLVSCRDGSEAERLSIDLGSSTVEQIDFAAMSLDGSATKEVVCFKASSSGDDANAGVSIANGSKRKEAKYQASGSDDSFTNCQSSVDFERNLAPDVTVSCDMTTVKRVESDPVARSCTGSWSGEVYYERDIFSCTRTDAGGSSEKYERRGEWRIASINCKKDEVVTASCPYGSGLVTYRRTNTLTNPNLSPNNPNWNYVSDTCNTDELSSCIGAYAGNNRTFSASVSGVTSSPEAETTTMAAYCPKKKVALCETERSVDCEIGSKTQRRSYVCGTGWTSWEDENIQECRSSSKYSEHPSTGVPTNECFFWVTGYVPGAGIIGSRNMYSNHVGVGNYPDANVPFARANAATFDTLAIGPKTRVIIYKSKDYKGGTYLNTRGPKAIGNSKFSKKNSKWIASPTYVRDPSQGLPSNWDSARPFMVASDAYKDMFPSSVRSNSDTQMSSGKSGAYGWGGGSVKVMCDTCNNGEKDTQSASCGSGLYGTKYRSRSCNYNGEIYDWGSWSGWNTSSCKPIICTPGHKNTETVACGTGYTGNQTRTRTCNSTGTAWGSWSGWNRSSCSAAKCQTYNFTVYKKHSKCFEGYEIKFNKGSISNSIVGNKFQGHTIRSLKQSSFYISGSGMGCDGVAMSDFSIEFEGDVRSKLKSIRFLSGISPFGKPVSWASNISKYSKTYRKGKTYYWIGESADYMSPYYLNNGSVELCAH